MNVDSVVVTITRYFAGAVLAGLVSLVLPAYADTIKSDDASVELTVPNGWRQTKPVSPKISDSGDGRACGRSRQGRP